MEILKENSSVEMDDCGETDDTGLMAMPPKKAKAPRLYHTKSRTGCQRCRSRRVKCNESRPVCSNCHRHNVPCIYIEGTRSKPKVKHLANQDQHSTLGNTSCGLDKNITLLYPQIQKEILDASLEATAFDDTSILDLPETKSRRLLELRLQQNYIENTSHTFSSCHYAEVAHAWSVEVPKLALEHDNVLYGMLSISTLHLLNTQPENKDLLLARQSYLALSLGEQRKAVAELSSKNAEAVCFSSSLILIDAFTRIRDREMDPYSPPSAWFHMARGAGSVFKIAFDAMDPDVTSKVNAIAKAKPRLNDGNGLFLGSNREGLEDLLVEDIPGEQWDNETRETYEMTLNYIGGIAKAISGGEHKMATCRRIMGFSFLAPNKFVDLVAMKKPRALVILAYFFALGWNMTDIWWFGRTAEKEVRGIEKMLPKEWHSHLQRPLDMIKKAAVQTV